MDTPVVPAPGFRSRAKVRGCYHSIGGVGSCVSTKRIVRIIPTRHLATSCANSSLTICHTLQFLGPSPCLFLIRNCALSSRGHFSVVNTSPRALSHVRGNGIAIHPLTNAHGHNRGTTRSLILRRRLLDSRGRVTGRLVLVRSNHGSVNHIYRYSDIGIARGVFVRHCSRIVRVTSGIRNSVLPSGSTLSIFYTAFPTNALANTPGVHTVRVVSRLRPLHHAMFNNTVNCLN